MKRAALVYSGQPRNLKECFENHVKHLIEKNQDWTFDFFGHLWMSKPDTAFWKEYPERGSWDSQDSNFLLFNWNPKRIVFETPKNFESNLSPDPSCPHPVQNTLSMLYSMEQANMAKKSYEQHEGFEYDCVIRIRTDVCFAESAGIDISSLDLSKMNVYELGAHREYGFGDQLAISSSKNMDKYSSVFTNVNHLVESGCVMNPECLVGFNTIKHYGIDVVSHPRGRGTDWQFVLYRDRGML